MSQLLCKQIGYLNNLAHCSPHQKQMLLTTATPEQIHAISEVCSNIIKGIIPLSYNEKERLRGHIDDLRDLANSTTPFKTKKQIISQRGGGFVSDVVTPLLSTLGMLIL